MYLLAYAAYLHTRFGLRLPSPRAGALANLCYLSLPVSSCSFYGSAGTGHGFHNPFLGSNLSVFVPRLQACQPCSAPTLSCQVQSNRLFGKSNWALGLFRVYVVGKFCVLLPRFPFQVFLDTCPASCHFTIMHDLNMKVPENAGNFWRLCWDIGDCVERYP